MTKTSNRLSLTAPKLIIAGVVGFALLLFVAILFVLVRQPSAAITVRRIKSVQSGDQFTETFEIANHTTSSYFVYPISVEVSNALGWKKCFDFSSFPGPILDPNVCDSETFEMTNLPTGSPLRLRMSIGKELAGLEGLFLRLDLRFRRGHKKVPLNPFDDTTKVFSSKQTQILSDEFVEHEPNPVGKRASEK